MEYKIKYRHENYIYIKLIFYNLKIKSIEIKINLMA